MNGSEFLIPCADRVANLPPYVFATVFRMKEKALAAGREVIDLGVGKHRDFCYGCDLSRDYITINADYHT